MYINTFFGYFFRIPVINAEDFTSSCDIVEDLENSIGGLFLGKHQTNSRGTSKELFRNPDLGFLVNPDADHY